jgi:hypothetical protein
MPLDYVEVLTVSRQQFDRLFGEDGDFQNLRHASGISVAHGKRLS